MSDIIAAPSVRVLAQKQGVDLEALARALGRQTLTREDVLQTTTPAAAKAQPSYWDIDHSQFGPVTEEPVSRFKQISAENLAAANQMIPQVTHHDRADVRVIEAFRDDLKLEATARGVKLTALAFHVKALAHALRAFPRFNASLGADGQTLILKGYVHIAVAVDTEYGLMVPVIRDVNEKGLWQIASQIADLAKRAQARKIRPEEMGGASMTITNLGGIGGTAFTPIVNPPEVAILGLTRTEVTPVWNGEAFEPVPMVPLDLSYDHRVINGAEAARFVRYFAGLIADPRGLLV